MRFSLTFISCCLCLVLTAQRITPDNVPANREMAENNIRQLRGGTLVVRLKTNEKSIMAYRDAGNNKLADKIEQDNRRRNLYLMLSFANQYNFSNVLFIEAQNTKKLLNRENNIYLNGKFEIDSSVKAPQGFYLIAEFGEVMGTEQAGDMRHSQSSSTPGSSSALIVSDSDLNQLKEPFPYSVEIEFSRLNGPPKRSLGNLQTDSSSNAGAEDVYLTSPFDKGVIRLNNRFESFYNKVINHFGQPYQGWLSRADKPASEKAKDKTIHLIEHELYLLDENKEQFTK